MTVYTGSALTFYGGEAAVAAGSIGADLMQCRRFSCGSTPKGVIIAPLVAGDRNTFCPSTIDTASSLTDEFTLGAFLDRNWEVWTLAVAVARGSAQELPTSGAAFLRFTGSKGLQNVALAAITDSSLSGGGSYAISIVVEGASTQDERQHIVVTGTVSGGQYKISWNGNKTAFLAHSATYAQIQTAMEALPGLGAGQILVSDGNNETGNVLTSATLLDTWSTPQLSLLGPSYNGNGMLFADTSGTFALPTGYSGSVHPARDFARPESFKSFTQFVQYWLQNFGAEFAGKPRLGFGGSWAATTLLWIMNGPERSSYYHTSPAGGSQDAVPTAGFFDAGIIYVPQSGMKQFADTGVFLGGVARSVAAGGPATLDQQSWELGERTDVLELDALSVLSYGTASPALAAANRARPMHLACSDWNTTILAPYNNFNTSKTIVNPHHGWESAAYTKTFGIEGGGIGRVTFVTTLATTGHTAALAAAGITPTLVSDGAALLAHRLAWLDNFYAEFIGVTPATSEGPTQELPFDAFAPGNLYAQLILDLGPLASITVTNTTDQPITGSWTAEADHWRIAAGASREWDRDKWPVASGELYIRAEDDDPTEGSVLVSVFRIPQP